jgi:putative transposase
LDTEWFATTKQAQTAINASLKQYNHIRPHQALNMKPPAPETLLKNGNNLGARQKVTLGH